MKKEKKYKLLLICPKQKYPHFGSQISLAKLLGKKVNNTSRALPILAGLTPEHYEIRIIDEEIEEVPKNYQADIVGITSITASVHRGKMWAEHFRKQGAKVIMGGLHASFNEKDCLTYADSLVKGEAENNWPAVLEDFEKGTLQKIYECKTPADFILKAKPRWDLIDTTKIISLSVQTSRGCPFRCEFCMVTKMFGRKIRHRDVDDVIEEIKSLPFRRILFVDDNLTINRKYAREGHYVSFADSRNT
jgi:radical SAM superfamily enzyme YgiQ (UPF0313 family)